MGRLTGAPSGHASDAAGMLVARSALVAQLATTPGAHRGFVDLALTMLAIAHDSPNPVGYAASAAGAASAVSVRHTSVVDPSSVRACQGAAVAVLAAGVRLSGSDRVRWLDQPEDWRHDADSWADPDGGAWPLPDSWVLRQPLWRWLVLAAVAVVVANGW